jgi:hypothetical protein
MNLDWALLLGKLPRYRALLHSRITVTVTMGNAMEMAVGLAYACFTDYRYLPDSHKLVFSNDKAEALWARFWPLLTALGISATI